MEMKIEKMELANEQESQFTIPTMKNPLDPKIRGGGEVVFKLLIVESQGHFSKDRYCAAAIFAAFPYPDGTVRADPL